MTQHSNPVAAAPHRIEKSEPCTELHVMSPLPDPFAYLLESRAARLNALGTPEKYRKLHAAELEGSRRPGDLIVAYTRIDAPKLVPGGGK